jgi:hypothetical protein
LLLFLLCFPSPSQAQYATKPGDAVGTAGGACAGITQNFGWPDANGHILQCVANVWTLVTQPGSGSGAAGSTGWVQFNTGGNLNADSNFFWDNTNKRLGIGTATPANALDVEANASGNDVAKIQNSNAAGYSTLNLYDNTGTAKLSLGYANASAAALYASRAFFNLENSSDLAIINGSAVNVMFKNGGNVGIGTTSPGQKLQVGSAADAASDLIRITNSGGSDANPTLSLFRSGSSEGVISYISGSKMLFGNDPAGGYTTALLTSAAKLTIDTNTGNVGIGTANPHYLFQTHTATDQNMAIYGPQSLADGTTLLSINDSAGALKGLELRGSPIDLTGGNVGMSATLLGVSKEQFAVAALKHPPLFCLKPETLSAKKPYLMKISKLLGSPDDFAALLATVPAALCYSTEYLRARAIIAKFGSRRRTFSSLITLSADKATSLILAHFTAKIARTGSGARALQIMHARGLIGSLPENIPPLPRAPSARAKRHSQQAYSH